MGRPGQSRAGQSRAPPILTFLEQLLIAAVQGANLLGQLLWTLRG